MGPGELVTGLVLSTAGIIVAGVGLAGWRGRLPRNFVAGIRTPATLRDDRAWDAAHRRAGWLVVLSGVALLVTGVALLTEGERADGWMTLSGLGAGLVLVLLGAVRGVRAARSAPHHDGAGP